ncbi:MAG TPA: VCBS repeat-containing protein, partial [Candidatus Kapabacteria bacterium]|nr:VCBS repeat-containing protein [Candidatus Kapabacteria bacterium]
MKKIILTIILIIATTTAESQNYLSSPANWLYPDGNPEATRYVTKRSKVQAADSFVVKWSTPAICGQIQPLIGNIINNPKINENYEAAPQEITAVVGNKIIVVDAKGKVHKKTTSIQNLKSVSALFDTTSNKLYNITTPVILGLETTETEDTRYKLIYGYLAGYIDSTNNKAVDSVAKLLSLSIDLRPFDPNFFGSIKPFYIRNQNDEKFIYSTINMTNPYVSPDYSVFDLPPFLRGFSVFNAKQSLAVYPLPNVADSMDLRRYLGPEINLSQPSITQIDNETLILFPNYPTEILDCVINDIFYYSNSNEAYLIMANIDAPDDITTNFNNTLDIEETKNKRPFIRSHFVKLNDGYDEKDFILLSESYKGYDGSYGKAKLHLYDTDGFPLTSPLPLNPLESSFQGGDNHLWSLAIGNVDGNINNSFNPWYPNNPGNEIIATQSTSELIYPGSMLYILRYKTDDPVPKSSNPNDILYHFDTIVSHRINGWVAAVNDIDGAPNGKDEIILADGANLRILRLRDYNSNEFRYGYPFDTVYTAVFPYQTITAVAVADLEGDGLNDVIVTTFDSTYVIGMPSENSLSIISPKIQEDPPAEYCNGDTLEIKWANVLLSAQKVNFSFQEYQSGTPVGSKILLKSNILNNQDTITFKYVLDTLLLGKQGRFLIQSSERPERISDSTAILRISLPDLYYSFASYSKIYTGDDLIIQGITSCVDSIGIEISIDSISWTQLAVTAVLPDG